MAIVRGDERDSGLARESGELGVDLVFFGNPLVLDCKEKVSFSKDVAQIVGGLAGRVVTVGAERHGHFSAQASRERDQALRMVCQQVLVNPRLVVVALQIGRRGELDQVSIAALVLAKQHQVVGTVGGGGAVKPVGGGHVGFAADNGVDSAVQRGVVELDGGNKIAVVGDRDGWLF